MFKIFVDSDCDITPSEARSFGFELISMPFIINGEMTYPYKDSDNFDFKEFYNRLRQGIIPKTTSINASEYIEYFEPFFKEGYDILYVHFSRAMSGTFNNMQIAIDELKEKYPERKFLTADTMAISLGAYYTLRSLADVYNEDMTIEEAQKYVENIRQHVGTYFYAPNLKFFAQSGRISNFAAFMGGIINLKAIITMNAEGEMKSIGKCRGTTPTLLKLIDYMVEKGIDTSKRVIVAHSDDIDTANAFSELIKKKFGEKITIDFTNVNPTAGSHCGPDNIGVSFYGKER